MRNILIVVSHPDDEILGVGGTVRKLKDEGDNISCLILGEGITSRSDNRNCVGRNIINKLQDCTMEASKIVGYSNVYFSELPDNRFDSVDLLDITKEVEKYIDLIKPEIVFTHHYGDLNIDHRRTFDAVLTACRPVGDYLTKEIYCFETPSSTEWNFKYGEAAFKPNVFIDIEKTLNLKLKAMECYSSEIREYPHPRSKKALEIIAARWGIVVGKKFVEAFELIRKVI